MFPALGILANQYTVKIIGALLGAGLIIGVYFWWVHSIEKDALREWNMKQLELTQQEMEKYHQKLGEINQEQVQIIQELYEKNSKLEERFNEFENYLKSPAVIDKYKKIPSSEVLKRTFKELHRK